MWTLKLVFNMSKAAWSKEICRCLNCRKCKDRIRKAAERSGNKQKYIPQGRKSAHQAATMRAVKQQQKEERKKEEEERKASKINM